MYLHSVFQPIQSHETGLPGERMKIVKNEEIIQRERDENMIKTVHDNDCVEIDFLIIVSVAIESFKCLN